ncbi:DNA-binding protein, partial [Leminorella grimontii]
MSIWLTAKECVALPGLPSMEHNIRHRLDKVVGGAKELRRRRDGTKAFEYHIDTLPLEAKEIAIQRHLQALMATPTDASPAPVVPKIKSREEGKITLYRKCPALMEQKLAELTTAQREVADARIALVVG